MENAENATFKGSFFDTLPHAASEIAERWNHLYIFLTVLSVIIFAGVLAAMIYFAWAHRKGGREGQTSYILHNTKLEVVWTLIPTIIVLFIFAWGWILYVDMATPPADSYVVRVVGQKWKWEFHYDHGIVTKDLYVPVDTPVKLIMSSDDVIHSFFIPDFRAKQDVVPGLYTTLWFEGREPGTHQIYCAEYCGRSHYDMKPFVRVLSEEDWDLWKRGRLAGAEGYKDGDSQVAQMPLKDLGAKLHQEKGCIACHSIDGSKLVGPSWKGIWGKQEELVDGKKVLVDADYVRESILNPTAKVTKGYVAGMMPPQTGINEREISALIEFIKSLK